MVDKVEEGFQMINICWKGRNVQLKSFCLFSVFWNLKYYNNHSWVAFQIVQIFDSFHETFSGVLFVFFIFLGIGLGCLLWENPWRSIWRSLFFIEEKGGSMMQKVEYHGKVLSFRLSYWVFLMLPQLVYILFSHSSYKTAGSISLNFASVYFTRNFRRRVKFCWWE